MDINLAIIINQARLTNSFHDLGEEIEHLLPKVKVSFIEAEGKSFSFSFKRFIAFERFVFGKKYDSFEILTQVPKTLKPDITFALGVKAKDESDFQVLFNGDWDLDTLYSGHLSGKTPTLAIKHKGEIISQMTPMIEDRRGLVTSQKDITSRLALLIVETLKGKTTKPLATFNYNKLPLTTPLLMKAALRISVSFLLNFIKKLVFFSPHWQVYYRKMQSAAPLLKGDLGEGWIKIKNPPMRFLADPFLFSNEGKNYLFVEDFDHQTGLGSISVLSFDEKGQVSKPITILKEPRHFSYPQVFTEGDHIYMMPETGDDGGVDLYRAVNFPYTWVKETRLIHEPLADSTYYIHEGQRYLFTTKAKRGSSSVDHANLYISDALKGEWHEHKSSPLRVDLKTARPAGTLFTHEGRLFRPVQDCEKGYGAGMNLMEITHLSPKICVEEFINPLKPPASIRSWRMHSYNRNEAYEVIDGSAISLKLIEVLRNILTIFRKN